MASLKERVTARVQRVRDRFPLVDHLVNTVTHYGAVEGNAQAGAVTFFGFLSFFPILALAFFAVGIIAYVYPDVRDDLRREIENLLPGVVGSDTGEIPMKTFQDYAATVGVFGLLGLLYSGLGWLSGMRNALENVFVLPKPEQPNFVFGKLRDIASLALIGLTLIVSVSLSGAVSGFSERLLTWVGVDPDAAVPNLALWLLGHGLAVAASTVLLLTMFRLLTQPHVPRRSLVEGAVLGAIGFEILKAAANFLIGLTKEQPAFQAFGVALILLIWINYFSRLVMYSASFAYTAPAAVAMRAEESMRAPAAALGNHEGNPESDHGDDHDGGVGSSADPRDGGDDAAGGGARQGGSAGNGGARADVAAVHDAELASRQGGGTVLTRPVGSHRAQQVEARSRRLTVAAVSAAVAVGGVLVAARRRTGA